MTAHDNIEQKLEQLAQALDSQDSIVQSVMSRIEAKPIDQARRGEKQKNILMMRRFIMNRYTKFAAAAVIVIGVIAGSVIIDGPGSSAYAIDQTIRANHSIRSIHIRNLEPGRSEAQEFWVEFSEDGEVKNVRLEFPDWASADGAKVVVWKDNKAQVWFKKKNTVATVKDKRVGAELLKMTEELDPRLAVERLQEQAAAGKVDIEIKEPSDESEAIEVVATYAADGSRPAQRRIWSVDPTTKLVTSIKFYQLKDGEYVYGGLIECLGYNEPIAAEKFILDEVPGDAMRVDQTVQEVGLVQGQLSDEEIAVEVVRQFIEALIAADYVKAGRLYAGLPAEFLEKRLAGVKFVRVVSIGKPEPAKINNSLKVPCKYEVEAGGVKSIAESGVFVRPVHGQPGRWSIDGGF